MSVADMSGQRVTSNIEEARQVRLTKLNHENQMAVEAFKEGEWEDVMGTDPEGNPIVIGTKNIRSGKHEGIGSGLAGVSLQEKEQTSRQKYAIDAESLENAREFLNRLDLQQLDSRASMDEVVAKIVATQQLSDDENEKDLQIASIRAQVDEMVQDRMDARQVTGGDIASAQSAQDADQDLEQLAVVGDQRQQVEDRVDARQLVGIDAASDLSAQEADQTRTQSTLSSALNIEEIEAQGSQSRIYQMMEDVYQTARDDKTQAAQMDRLIAQGEIDRSLVETNLDASWRELDATLGSREAVAVMDIQRDLVMQSNEFTQEEKMQVIIEADKISFEFLTQALTKSRDEANNAEERANLERRIESTELMAGYQRALQRDLAADDQAFNLTRDQQASENRMMEFEKKHGMENADWEISTITVQVPDPTFPDSTVDARVSIRTQEIDGVTETQMWWNDGWVNPKETDMLRPASVTMISEAENAADDAAEDKAGWLTFDAGDFKAFGGSRDAYEQDFKSRWLDERGFYETTAGTTPGAEALPVPPVPRTRADARKQFRLAYPNASDEQIERSIDASGAGLQ